MFAMKRLIAVFALTVFWTLASAASATAGPLKVLFLGFDNGVDAVRLDILGSDARFDHANSASWDGLSSLPTLAQLQAYDAVLAWANYVPPTAAGNVLADYADGGGHVVLTTFWGWATSNGNDLGRINNTGYNPLTGGTGNAYSAASLGTHNAAHPLFAGVTTLDASVYRGDWTGVDAGATLLGSWDDGTPLAAINGLGNVLNLTLFPNVATYGHASGDYDQLFRNALALAGDPQTAPVPEPGTLGLLALGGIGAVIAHRRRARKA